MLAEGGEAVENRVGYPLAGDERLYATGRLVGDSSDPELPGGVDEQTGDVRNVLDEVLQVAIAEIPARDPPPNERHVLGRETPEQDAVLRRQ